MGGGVIQICPSIKLKPFQELEFLQNNITEFLEKHIKDIFFSPFKKELEMSM